MRHCFLALLMFFITDHAFAGRPDSLKQRKEIGLEEINIRGYFREQSLLRFTGSASVISPETLRKHGSSSLLPALNTVAGVQMEERSPASYRLSIRGSLLRSPFGVRNVKVYLDETPLTDAGGNTYFNLLDPAAISKIEVLKGPDGSIFGANSGGVVLLDPLNTSVSNYLRIQSGSFGRFHQQLGISEVVSPEYEFSIHQSFQRSDGYRENTGVKKQYYQTRHVWKYRADRNGDISPDNQLKALFLYGDLDYQTPGGLTEAQRDENPRAARPSTATTPGALEQHAGIHNRTWLGSITHQWKPVADLRHIASIFGSGTKFDNPFITNYEQRAESNFGFRTYLSYFQPQHPDSKFQWQFQLGMEWQQGNYQIDNFDNNGGEIGNLQQSDFFKTSYTTYFSRIGVSIGQKTMLETSLSKNFQEYDLQAINIPGEWMPRFALSHLLNSRFAFRAVLSKGFSAPTIAEIRPSNQKINTNLYAETGWNKELGIRIHAPNHNWLLDLTAFSYKMDKAIVRGIQDDGEEFFQNAGIILQNGIELSGKAVIIESSEKKTFQNLIWEGQWTWSPFYFKKYNSGDSDFTGNALPGISPLTWSQNFSLSLFKQFNLSLTHRFSAKAPLNDANDQFSKQFQLVQARLSYTAALKSTKSQLTVHLLGDNLFDENYSLGNDINAFGRRFFNPAPARNFTAGIALLF